jgi:hypothetical protein
MCHTADKKGLGTMNKTLTAVSSDTSALYQANLEEYLTNIDHLREQMRHDQEEIDRSRTRTQVILDDLARLFGSSSSKAA